MLYRGICSHFNNGLILLLFIEINQYSMYDPEKVQMKRLGGESNLLGTDLPKFVQCMLTSYCEKAKFRMETTSSIMSALRQA